MKKTSHILLTVEHDERTPARNIAERAAQSTFSYQGVKDSAAVVVDDPVVDALNRRIGRLRATLSAIASKRYQDGEILGVASEAIDADDATVPATQS